MWPSFWTMSYLHCFTFKCIGGISPRARIPTFSLSLEVHFLFNWGKIPIMFSHLFCSGIPGSQTKWTWAIWHAQTVPNAIETGAAHTISGTSWRSCSSGVCGWRGERAGPRLLPNFLSSYLPTFWTQRMAPLAGDEATPAKHQAWPILVPIPCEQCWAWHLARGMPLMWGWGQGQGQCLAGASPSPASCARFAGDGAVSAEHQACPHFLWSALPSAETGAACKGRGWAQHLAGTASSPMSSARLSAELLRPHPLQVALAWPRQHRSQEMDLHQLNAEPSLVEPSLVPVPIPIPCEWC